jgi:hypothetical protein
MKGVTMKSGFFARLCLAGLLFATSQNALASFHLSQIREVFSDASGTVQFIELTALAGGQQFIAGHTISSSAGGVTRLFTFPSDLPGDTAVTEGGGGCGIYGEMCMTTYKSFLIGTQGFAALNIVTPDYIVPNGFLFTSNGTVNFAGVDVFNYASLPQDGRLSLKRDGSVSLNTPTNFSGVSASVASAALSVISNQVAPVAGSKVTLSAFAPARRAASVATFNENGVALPGCASVPVRALPGATTVGVATCSINAIAAGSHTYTVTHSQGVGGTDQANLSVNVPAVGPPDYTDMWWAGKVEDGWGVSITQHGRIQFIVIYAYDSAGKPIWYVVPGGDWNSSQTAFTGAAYVPTSARFDAYDKAQFKVGAPVGTVTVSYTASDKATLSFTLSGVSGSKAIERQLFALDDGQPKLQVADLWWATDLENGWGMNIAQQGRVLFPVWYTYDADGRTIFLVVPGGTWNGNIFTGDIYTTTSSPWLGTTYDTTRFKVTKVGTMSLTFMDQANATMSYTVNGVAQTKTIVRQPY